MNIWHSWLWIIIDPWTINPAWEAHVEEHTTSWKLPDLALALKWGSRWAGGAVAHPHRFSCCSNEKRAHPAPSYIQTGGAQSTLGQQPAGKTATYNSENNIRRHTSWWKSIIIFIRHAPSCSWSDDRRRDFFLALRRGSAVHCVGKHMCGVIQCYIIYYHL